VATIGDTAKPNTELSEAYSNYNQSAQLFTMPERGRIVTLGMWASAYGGNASARLVLWNSSGAVLGRSPTFTLVSRAVGIGNVDRYEETLESPVRLEAGVSFYAGISHDPSKSHQLTGRASGGPNHHFDNRRTTWPGTIVPNDTGGHGFGDYTVGAYVADYQPTPGAWVYRSGAWVEAESVSVYRSSAWTEAESVQLYRSGSWEDAE
jgi:hypothetical protein